MLISQSSQRIILRHKLQIFTIKCTVSPQSSIRFFLKRSYIHVPTFVWKKRVMYYFYAVSLPSYTTLMAKESIHCLNVQEHPNGQIYYHPGTLHMISPNQCFYNIMQGKLCSCTSQLLRKFIDYTGVSLTRKTSFCRLKINKQNFEFH